MNWITWLRGFSIRSRLIACMALVVVIGTIVGVGMSWRLLSLKGEFDSFAQQEFAATQRMAVLFPDPLGPSSVKNCPSGISKLTPRNAATLPRSR